MKILNMLSAVSLSFALPASAIADVAPHRSDVVHALDYLRANRAKAKSTGQRSPMTWMAIAGVAGGIAVAALTPVGLVIARHLPLNWSYEFMTGAELFAPVVMVSGMAFAGASFGVMLLSVTSDKAVASVKDRGGEDGTLNSFLDLSRAVQLALLADHPAAAARLVAIADALATREIGFRPHEIPNQTFELY